MEEELKLRTRLRGKATRLSNDLKEYRSSSKVDQDDLAYKIHVLEKVKADLRDVQVTCSREGQSRFEGCSGYFGQGGTT